MTGTRTHTLSVSSARRRLGLTQVHLAAVLGVSQSTVSRWERGEGPIDPPSVRLLLVLHDAPADLGPRLTEALHLRGGLYALYVLLDDHFTRNPSRP